VTDKLEHYRKGFNQYFRNIADLEFGILIKRRKYGYKHNNNCVEREHQYLKDRTKIMRHFGDFESADDILNFYDVHYNFIAEQKLKNKKRYRTPAQRAEIKIELSKRKDYYILFIFVLDSKIKQHPIILETYLNEQLILSYK